MVGRMDWPRNHGDSLTIPEQSDSLSHSPREFHMNTEPRDDLDPLSRIPGPGEDFAMRQNSDLIDDPGLSTSPSIGADTPTTPTEVDPTKKPGGSRELIGLALPLVVSQSFMTAQVFLDTILLSW